ncbi:MAG: hypothetical protein P4M05_12820 [Bradyrhizobium sp.]|nr:hypothetical protein [Bradyrhizobium sp.]
MQEICRKEAGATRAEIIIVFVTLTATIVFSYYIAHQAAANTPPDPVFRHLVQPESTKPSFKTEYLYVPLLFQFVAWLSVGVSLLPARIQESWFLKTTQNCQRRYLYFTVAFCSLILAEVNSNSSNALMKTSAFSIDQSSPAEVPNSSTH